MNAPAVILALLLPLSALLADVASVKEEIEQIPAGALIELQAKFSRRAFRGKRGQLSDSGFTLVRRSGREQRVTFADVVSVKRVKSHRLRNHLIALGIGAGAGVIAGRVQ